MYLCMNYFRKAIFAFIIFKEKKKIFFSDFGKRELVTAVMRYVAHWVSCAMSHHDTITGTKEHGYFKIIQLRAKNMKYVIWWRKEIFSPVGVFDFHFHELVNTYENNSGTKEQTYID